jgi:hypothetical protein
VQSDILNRIQESHGHLEVEIRKLLHEVSRVAEQALSNARRVREAGATAVETARERLGTLERGREPERCRRSVLVHGAVKPFLSCFLRNGVQISHSNIPCTHLVAG